MALSRCGHLIKDGQGVTHGSIGLLGDHIEGCRLGLDGLLLTDVLQLLYDVGNGDTREVINLAARQNCGNHLLLLGGSENEDGIFRRFLQCLEECVESGLRQHVHLIDDEDAVPSRLRRDAYLFGQVTDVINTIVGRAIQLIDVVGTLLVERDARRALVTSLAIGRGMLTVDGLGKNAGTSRLSHASRATKEVGMRQTSTGYRRLERVGQRLLPHHATEGRGPVFSRRYDILLTHQITN